MKKILLIEDNNEMRENTAEILGLANYNVATAPNGKEGVKLAQTEKPDLIICDIMMPELDGYGVLHMLSKNTETAGIPFIFLTAKAERADHRKGMSMGADDYLTKPFDDMELLGAVETRLKKSEYLKAKYAPDLDGLNKFLTEAQDLSELVRISDKRKVKVFKKKDVVYQEDAYPAGIFFLNRGKVKTSKINADGKELITALVNAGEFFGYTALLEEQAYSDSAVALDESEICIIPKEDFFSLLYNSRDVATAFIRMLSNDLKDKEERLLHLAYNSVRKRVAEALLLLRQRYAGDKADPFSMAISREDLANLAGTAQETVIRTLSDFKDEKLVDIKGSTITLVDVGKLERMKN
jgi:CRP/FNR family transcriptional regulator, polysaccharide utilization system transcription regulator